MFVINDFEPFNQGCGVFPLVKFGCSRDLAVDSVEHFFAHLVGLISLQVWFVVFQCEECVFVSCGVHSVIDAQIAVFLFSLWMACVVVGSAFL